MITQLDPFLDQSGLLRVGGKLIKTEHSIKNIQFCFHHIIVSLISLYGKHIKMLIMQEFKQLYTTCDIGFDYWMART